jgi:hypothetical protein
MKTECVRRFARPSANSAIWRKIFRHLPLRPCGFPGLLFIVPVCFFPVLAGCSSPSAPDHHQAEAPPAGVAKAKDDQRLFDGLKKGMTAAQVRNLVGEPAEVRPFKAGGLKSNVWVYPGRVFEHMASVPIGTREVPQVDPMTGRSTTIKEPIYEYKAVKVSETIELLVIEDQLIEWGRKVESKSK